MMTDYERVTELQQISARSAGATMAQMEKYLHSIDAASNKVRVAWENIITTVSDSEFIINLVEQFAVVLENLNRILTGEAGFGGELIKIGIGLIAITKLFEAGSNKFVEKTKNELALQKEINDLRTEIETKRKTAYEDVGEQAEALRKVEDREDYKEVLEEDSELKIAQDDATRQRKIKTKADEEVEKAQEEFDKADAEVQNAQAAIELADQDAINAGKELENALEARRLALGAARIEQEHALLELEQAFLELKRANESGDETQIKAAQEKVNAAQERLSTAEENIKKIDKESEEKINKV